MLDLKYFANRRNNVQLFTNPNVWQTWVKPRGAKIVDIMCIGGGAGGAGGPAANANNNGGAGGAAAAYTKATFSANLLPDVLYVYSGAGGKGGTGGIYSPFSNPNNSLISGSISYVTITPDTGSISGILCRSGNRPAIIGASGGGTVATFTQMPLIALAINYNTVAGQNSVTSSSTQTNIIPTTIITPGMAGSGYYVGGALGQTGIANAGAITGVQTSLTSSVGETGGDGYIIYKPILAFVGGAGGRAIVSSPTNSGIAGFGGEGAPGAGGGGGGLGFQSSVPGSSVAVGGNGGDGGNGIVIITTKV